MVAWDRDWARWCEGGATHQPVIAAVIIPISTNFWITPTGLCPFWCNFRYHDDGRKKIPLCLLVWCLVRFLSALWAEEFLLCKGVWEFSEGLCDGKCVGTFIHCGIAWGMPKPWFRFVLTCFAGIVKCWRATSTPTKRFAKPRHRNWTGDWPIDRSSNYLFSICLSI